MNGMKSESGTYALILQSGLAETIKVGRWGKLTLKTGYYIYIGSAFGPGGVRARVLRHCRLNKRKHWHLDYLRRYVTPLGAWCSYEPSQIEHQWATVVARMDGSNPIKGFGCSDCTCYSHFFFLATEPDFEVFSAGANSRPEVWSYQSLGVSE